MSELIVEPVSRRPDLAPLLWSMPNLWPTFMTQDLMSNLFYDRVTQDFPAHALVAYDPREPNIAVARALSIPFAFGAEHGREALPDAGWDGVIDWGMRDHAAGVTPNHVSALEIAIRPDRRGSGLAAVMLTAMRNSVAELGYTDLVAPVRPSGKPAEPHQPMDEYAHRRRPDGLPADPWLRVHVRAGGRIVAVCSRAMTISGSLAEWRAWTGLPFDATGDVVVPGALVPVHCSLEHDHVAYVEPGVWIHHDVR